MKLSPILSAGVALLLAACGTDLYGEGKGDIYDSSVKQADEARKAGDLDAAIPLYGRALEANPNGVEAKLGLGQAYLSAGLGRRGRRPVPRRARQEVRQSDRAARPCPGDDLDGPARAGRAPARGGAAGRRPRLPHAQCLWRGARHDGPSRRGPGALPPGHRAGARATCRCAATTACRWRFPDSRRKRSPSSRRWRPAAPPMVGCARTWPSPTP